MNDFSIALVRNKVSLNCTMWGKVLPHVFVTIVILELWKHKDKIVKIEDKERRKYADLLNLFQAIRRAIGRRAISTESMAQMIYTRFLCPLSIDDLKKLLGESPVYQFPQNKDEGMIFLKTSSNPPVLKGIYTNIPNLLNSVQTEVEAAPEQEATQTPMSVTIPEAPVTNNTPIFSSLIQVKRELEQLYDRLADSRGPSFNKPTYIWQWAFNIDEYAEITRTASQCLNLRTNEEKEALLHYDKCVFILVAYVAERFKREWNGNTHNESSPSHNALIQIGYDRFSEEIAKKYFGTRSERMIFMHENGRHEYLQSLRMEGGFPVKRIYGDNTLADFAEHLYEQTDKAIDILCERVQDSCMRHSYQEKLSIYHYIVQLLQANGIHTIYGSDVANAPDIKNFADFLTNGRAEADRKKTRLSFEVWHDTENNSPVSITPILYMYPEENGERNYAISQSRLESWGLNNVSNVNSFSLNFFDSNEQPVPIYDENCSEMESIYYSKCYNGDFVEFNARKKFFLPTIMEENLNMENIFLNNYTCRLQTDTSSTFESIKIIPKRKTSHDYIQLYSNDNKFWVSSKGRDPYKYSALIVKVSKKCHPTHDNYEDLSNGLVWVPFTTHVELCINGNNKIIYNAQGSIYAFPQGACIHPICRSPYAKYLDSGQVEFFSNSQPGPDKIHLVQSSGIRFDIYRENKWTEEKTKINSEPHITYRRGSGSDWKEYDPNKNLAAGYIEFNISIDNRYSTVVKCFVLPSDCTLDIDLQNRRVLFRNIDCVVRHNNSQLSLLKGGTYSYPLPSNPKTGSNDFEGSNGLLTFSVNCDEGYFHIMTLHPIEGTFYMLQNGRLLNSKINKYRTVPLALLGRFKKVKLDNTGGTIENVGCASPEAYGYVLEQNLNCTLPTAEKSKEVDGCRYVAYSGSFEKLENKRIYKIQGAMNPQHGGLYFMSLESNETIELIPDEDRCLNLESIEQEGIIFQSLKGRTALDLYLRPMYVPHKDSKSSRPKTDEKKQIKTSRIKEYILTASYPGNDAFRCFSIAAEHGLYFSAFDILLSMIAEYRTAEIPTRICKFLAGYEKYCKQANLSPNYTALWRLSTEFVFDWLFISKADYAAAGVSDELRNGLYESRPPHRIDDLGEYNTFIDWINADNNENLRGKSVKNSLLKKKHSIFNTDDGKTSIKCRIDFLNKAYNQTFKDINDKRKLD